MMKNILNILGAACALCLISSCTPEIDSLFPASPEARIQKSINKYQEVLIHPENGWLMQYFPDPYQDNTEEHPQYGGFNVMVKFTKDGHATFASEKTGYNVTATSSYSIFQSSGVVISFDTYNKVLHYFSDPANPDNVGKKGIGYGGDFEFRIISAEPNKVVMQGKKRNSHIVLTPMKGEWSKYFEEVHKLDYNMTYGAYVYKVGNKTAQVSRDKNLFTFAYKDKDGNIVKQNAPFMVTPTGVIFHDTLSILDAKVKTLTFNNETNTFKSDGNSGATLTGVILPLNEALISGSHWYANINNLSPMLHQPWQMAAQELKQKFQEELKMLYWYDHFLLFQSGKYQGMYEWTVKKEGTDIVEIGFKGPTGTNAQRGNANYYITNLKNFKFFIVPFIGKYKITTDNLKNPSWLLLTNLEKPKITIKLVKEDVKPY